MAGRLDCDRPTLATRFALVKIDRAPVQSFTRLLRDEAQALAHLLGRVGRLAFAPGTRAASLQDLAGLRIDGLLPPADIVADAGIDG